MRAAFYTLGCKVNQYETAALMQQFAAYGFDIVQPDEDADVYVINSCTVTATGDKKSRQMLRRFRRQNPAAVLCLCGCFPQAFPQEALDIPEADVVAGSKNRAGLLDAVLRRMQGGERVVALEPHHKGQAFESMGAASFAERTRAFVKIQDGCSRYCAYCIIPTARGPVRSKPLADLQQELEQLAQAGFREVVLVGINLSCYGQDLGLHLLDAVELACGVPGILRVRLGSLEPELLGREQIRRLSQLPKLCPQFHLSLQSGCDETLQGMRRHYDTGEYRRIVSDLREYFDNVAITTDVMVGFPGEQPQHHQQSMDFCREIGLAKAHVFAYSVRPGTLAAKLPQQVEQEVKVRRSAEMTQVTQETRRKFLAQQVGRQVQVLLEQQQEDGSWQGYSENYTPVRLRHAGLRQGELVEAEIVEAGDDFCVATLAR